MELYNLYLIAGHHNNDSGAIGVGGVKESKLTIELREMLIEQFGILLNNERGLRSDWLKIHKDNDSYNLNQTINWLNQQPRKGLVIDLHFNAFTNPTATGTEAIINASTAKNKLIVDLANKILKSTSQTLKVTNRGVKNESQSQHNRLGILHTKHDALLYECVFITNPEDLVKYNQNKRDLAFNLANIIYVYLKQYVIS